MPPAPSSNPERPPEPVPPHRGASADPGESAGVETGAGGAGGQTDPAARDAAANGATARSVFVADLHLGFSETPRHRAFRAFLGRLREETPRPALFILGDLFHYWVGRGSERAPGHRAVLDELARTSGAGVAIWLVRGNRDFLIDGRIAARYGLHIAREALSLCLGDLRVLACHGDLLLLNDRSHRRFRWVLRSFWLRGMAAALPHRWTDRLAERIRRSAVRATERKEAAVFEVSPEAVARLLRGGYDALVCGHVHRAEKRRLVVDDREREFFTLGAWEEAASVLEYDGKEFRFSSFAIAD